MIYGILKAACQYFSQAKPEMCLIIILLANLKMLKTPAKLFSRLKSLKSRSILNNIPAFAIGAYEFDWKYLGDFAGGCDVVLSGFGVLAQSWGADDPAIDIPIRCAIHLGRFQYLVVDPAQARQKHRHDKATGLPDGGNDDGNDDVI